MNTTVVRILAVDLGSTYFKCAIVDVEPGECAQIDQVVRLRVDQAKWLPGEAAHCFQTAIASILEVTEKLAAAAAPVAVSLTGVREGVALGQLDGKLIRVISNAEAILWQAHYGSEWLKAIISESAATETIITSLQSWLAFVLTGRLAITESELKSWNTSMWNDSLQERPVPLSSRFFPSIVPVGTMIGRSTMLGGVPVTIAGTDEYASHYGAGLGRGSMAELGAGTYWSLSRVFPSSNYNPPPHIRVLPAVRPYPMVASYVGYHWGEYISDLQENRRPEVPKVLPSWSKSHFVDELREGRCSSVERAIELICEDLLEAYSTLPTASDFPDPEIVVVHGGGLTASSVARAVVLALGWQASFIEADPTLVGSALVAAKIGHANETNI